MAFLRLGLYTFQPGTIDAIIQKAQAELVPMTQRQPGLRRYHAIRTGADTAASISSWDTEAQAQAASESLAGWVRREFAPSLIKAENHVGEVVISHVPAGAVAGYAGLALWQLRPGAADEVIAAARTEFLPLVVAQPGFVSYGIARTGPDTLASLTVFDTAAHLQASHTATAQVVQRATAGRGEATQRYEGAIIWSVTGAGR
jgi:heme-degrading monooxygenase HmoA